MIRIRVTRTGVVTASGLVALTSSLAACTAETAEDVGETSESGLTVANPGTGVFNVTWAYGTTTGYTFTATNSTDEFVRAGEKMSFSVPAFFMWSRLHPNDPMPNDVARLQKLKAKVHAVHVKGGATLSTSSLSTTAWQGTQPWDLAATTSTFTVAKKADAIRFRIELSDAGDPTANAALVETDFFDVPVIGGALPDKTLLFDSMFSDFRSRVLEGGDPIGGAHLALAYSDWRAATVVDSANIDKTIGTFTNYSRFGMIESPMEGTLEYEVSYESAVDGAWQAEAALAANTASRLMPANGGRTAYEASLALPKGGKQLDLVFHVKAFLKVDYTRYPNIKTQKYAQGDRILVRDVWDNPNHAAFTNYTFAIR